LRSWFFWAADPFQEKTHRQNRPTCGDLVRKDGNDYFLSGVGFGDYAQSRLERLFPVLSVPKKLYIRKMLKGLDRVTALAGSWFAEKCDFSLTYDLARQLLTIDILARSLGDLGKRSICIIGDGYGALGTILKKRFYGASITFINIGRTLFFDVYFSQQCFPTSSITVNDEGTTGFDFRYVEAETIDAQKVEADLFINVASMQEMDHQDIQKYFALIRCQAQDTYFYCCNRISKTLPDGATLKFDDYGWQASDSVLFDELYPWHQHFPVSRPPFLRPFDGPIKHRLVKVSIPAPPQP
jgi:hypothetical protein